MTSELDERYFAWLVKQAVSVESLNGRTYESLFRLLHQKEFVGWVPNDMNRVKEGQKLRAEFLAEANLDLEAPDIPGCSMLEMLIPLCRRAAYETNRSEKWWFWHLIKNLGLENYADDVAFNVEEVDEVLDAVVWRSYSYDGVGGLFPLERAPEDQRHVELWYQLNAYLIERY